MRTQIIGVEGEGADHSATATTQLKYPVYSMQGGHSVRMNNWETSSLSDKRRLRLGHGANGVDRMTKLKRNKNTLGQLLLKKSLSL